MCKIAWVTYAMRHDCHAVYTDEANARTKEGMYYCVTAINKYCIIKKLPINCTQTSVLLFVMVCSQECMSMCEQFTHGRNLASMVFFGACLTWSSFPAFSSITL